MTRWTEHVKGFAQEYGLSYGCAMTNALCKSSYAQHYPKAAKEPKAAREPKAAKEKKVRQKVKEEQEIIFSQAAKDMMKGDIEFFTEMASSPEHLDALINDPTIYYQGPEMKAFTQAAVLDNWARSSRSKNPNQILFPASQAFIPLEENIPIQKPKRTQPKLKPRGGKSVPKVTAEEAMFELLREEMPDVPRMPRNRGPSIPKRSTMPTLSTKKPKSRISGRQFIPMEEAYPDVVSKNITINRNVRKPISFIPMEESYPDVVSKNITITKPKPKRKPRAPPKGTTKKQEEHDYNVSMFAQYFPEDEAFIEENVDKSKSQLKPLAAKYKVNPNEEFLFMAILKARRRSGKGLMLKSRAENAGGLGHIYPLSRNRILKLMRE